MVLKGTAVYFGKLALFLQELLVQLIMLGISANATAQVKQKEM